MSTVTVKFVVTPAGTVASYWISVGNQDVPLKNGQGSVNVSSPSQPLLVWHFEGNAGDSLAITGTVGSKTVVQVKGSTIPPKQSSGAGSKRFQV
jgi:hypothetical protein